MKQIEQSSTSRLSAAVILVHHVAKGQTKENIERPCASFISSWADWIIILKRKAKYGKVFLKVTCQKSIYSAGFKTFYIDITDFTCEPISSFSYEKLETFVKVLNELAGDFFKDDARFTSAFLERLLHNADTVVIEGKAAT